MEIRFRKRFARPARVVVFGAAIVTGAVAIDGCSQTTKSGEPTGTGFFTGYEIGNEQDIAEVRKDRPGYRPYE